MAASFCLFRRNILKSCNKLYRPVQIKQTVTSRIQVQNLHSSQCLFGVKPTLIKMPSLSPTMTEGTILTWTKKEGDSVCPGDVLCEIQTDKAVISFEMEENGTLAKILIPADTKDVKIGTLIALMVEEGEDWKDVDVPTDTAATGAPSPAATKPAEAAPSAPTTPGTSTQVGTGPAVKNLLQMYGLQPEVVTATGPHGQLLKGDVLNHVKSKNLKPVEVKAVAPPTAAASASKPAAAPVKPVVVGEQVYVDIEHTNMRKTIAKRLTQSKSTVPHSYGTADCDITDILQMRKKLKADGVKVSVNDFIIKAAAIALQTVPELNVQYVDDKVRYMGEIDISVAVATDAGLITPIVKDAVGQGIESISNTVKALAQKAKDGKLQPHEFMGGTFTISNLGMFGITEFSAIINPPQSAIMAVGGSRLILDPATEQPRSRMTATISYDARAVDDAAAALFLEAFQELMENPGLLIAGLPRRDSDGGALSRDAQ